MTVERGPEDTIRRYTQHVRDRDLEALVALYEPEAVFSQEPAAEVRGRQALREVFRGFLASQPKLDVVTATVHAAGDLALVTNDWTLEGRDPAGAPLKRQGRSAVVLRRQADGGWLIAIDRV
jgi:uncharacterized protein (TIGR02246 family)